jgi:hypothetical protein
VAAVAAALSGAPVDPSLPSDDGTAARRSRAARLAAALGGSDGWGAASDEEDSEAEPAEGWGLDGKSRYAKMRKALRDEAAARLLSQAAAAQ